jgi:hypothetical protein
MRAALLLLVAACAGGGVSEPDPVVPGADAATEVTDAFPDARVDAAAPPPDARPPSPDARPPSPDARPPSPDARPPDAAPAAAWSDAEKCENMCQSYCVHKYMCDRSSIDACRMAIDDADGGTCQQRAGLFEDIPQSQVEACIDAIEAMTCPDFLHMYNTGEGVPAPCHGILI